MQKFVSDILFGLGFGIGFLIAAAVAHLLGALLMGAKWPGLF